MKKLLYPGPWRVRLRHCQPAESVNNRSSSEEAPFFYAYEPVFSKLGLKLPFTTFEQSALRALNVAPSQFTPTVGLSSGPSSCCVRIWGRLRLWGSFSGSSGLRKRLSRPKRKLLKPFLESFKIFKDKFFKICPGKSGPSLMFDPSGAPLFPLYWTSQPVVSIKDLKKNMPSAEGEGASAAADTSQAAVPLQEVPGDLSPHSARSEAVAVWSAGE
ncbi:hypothetical protein CR513_05406, partial [Mucuna pruriens]